MPPETELLRLRARWIFPVVGPPLEGGTITLRGPRIESVGPSDSGSAIDLGDVAILPGLVNAHTHLEFSDLAEPLGQPGESLPDWIRKVLAHRRAASATPDHAVRQGLRESASRGTATLGEIATRPWPDLSETNADTVVFCESLGLLPSVIDERLAVAREQLDRTAALPAEILPGLSPHAPYSTHPALVAGLVDLAVERRLPVAMHLAESREELELLAAGTGPFRALLEDLGVWTDDALPRGGRVLDYLQELARAPRALAIHGNYLTPEETAFLAGHAATMAVVYCPRTHRRFGHAGYPLARLMRAGVQIALGTDSRASNPDLSLLAEMRWVANEHADVSPAAALELATLGGARALGLEQRSGALRPGHWANLAIVPVAAARRRDPHELLFESDAAVRQTWFHGRPIT